MTTCVYYKTDKEIHLIADTQETYGDNTKGITAINKIVTVNDWTVIFCGDVASAQKALSTLKKLPVKQYTSCDLQEAFINLHKDVDLAPNFELIAVGQKKGKHVLTIAIDGHTEEEKHSICAQVINGGDSKTPYIAIGTGENFAFGALAALDVINKTLNNQKAGSPIPVTTMLQISMSAAAKYDVYTSPQFNHKVIKLCP